MPFYLVEQKGVPGARLVEAEKPAGAINHVIGSTFTAKRLQDRDLIDAARTYDVEVAGAPVLEPEEPKMTNGGNPGEPSSGDGLDPDAQPATDDFGERT